MVGHDRDYVLEILLVRLHDLELREQQIGWRDSALADVEPVPEVEHVARPNAIEENVSLAADLRVIEEESPLAVQGVEIFLRHVADLGEEDFDLAAVAAAPNEVDIAIFALKRRALRARADRGDRDSAREPQMQAHVGGRVEESRASMIGSAAPTRLPCG